MQQQSTATRYSPLQFYMYARLKRLIMLRAGTIGWHGPQHDDLTLIHRALFSTYLDCVWLGLADEARELFGLYGMQQAVAS